MSTDIYVDRCSSTMFPSPLHLRRAYSSSALVRARELPYWGDKKGLAGRLVRYPLTMRRLNDERADVRERARLLDLRSAFARLYPSIAGYRVPRARAAPVRRRSTINGIAESCLSICFRFFFLPSCLARNRRDGK